MAQHQLVARGDWTLAASLGLVGGTLLALSQVFFTSGKGILITYAIVVAMIALSLRGRAATFVAQTVVVFAALLVASFIHYVVVSLGVAALPFLGHVWRLGVVAALCAAVSVPVARISVA